MTAHAQLRAKLIARWCALADGAEPARRTSGVCYDTKVLLYGPADDSGGWTYSYALCSGVFLGLGLDPTVPVRYMPLRWDEDLWNGRGGPERRKLARRMAEWLAANTWYPDYPERLALLVNKAYVERHSETFGSGRMPLVRVDLGVLI